MKCERCGIKGVRLHELRVTYESGNGRIYPLCMDCTHDVLEFIDLPPDFNCHGYNLNFFEQSKECDTRYNRGYANSYIAADVSIKRKADENK